MKKITALLLCQLMILSAFTFSACGGNGENESRKEDPGSEAETPENGGTDTEDGDYRTADKEFNDTPPVFDSETDADMLPYMEAVLLGRGPLYENENGNVVLGSTDFGRGDGVNSGVMFAGPVLKDGGTMYFHTVILPDAEYDSKNGNSKVYGAPVIRLANARFYKQERQGGFQEAEGYLDIVFTKKEGVDFRIRSKSGTDLYDLGQQISAFRFDYPDNKSANRGKSEYEVTVALSRRRISVWINGKAVLLNQQLFSMQSANKDDENVLDIIDIAPGVLYNLAKGSSSGFAVWCSKDDLEPYEIGGITYPDGQ